ncbi:MAG: xylulokinase [Clostridia bacterium]|nr:xylulokinase [Clostridia bacterium]
MKYLLAHDLGTSGNKATLFNEDGQLISSVVYAYDTDYFNETWAEQDPNNWWKAVCETSAGLIEKAKIDAGDIAAVAFSGQMMGCLCVDRQGRPLRKHIIWADQRAVKQAEELGEKIELWDYFSTVGHRNSPNYGLQKLMWIRDNEPDVYKNTYKTLNAKDYIVYKLTGNFFTEPSDGSSNACLDLKTFDWSQRIVDLSGIDADKLPKVVPSTHVAGCVTSEAAKATGLKEGTPVVMGGGDGSCTNVGAGSVNKGKSFCYMGSSAWIATTSDTPILDPQMRTITWAHIVPGMYAPNGTMQSGGGSYAWLKNQICVSETERAKRDGLSPYDLINYEIEKASIGAGGVIFLPYLLGERAPRWDVDARGAFVGLKMENQRRDILRSVMEGVTMNLAIVLDVLRQDVDISELIVIGGGAKGRIWRQIMADIYDVTIKVPALLEEATSMGAAVAGGVGVGIFKDFDAIDRFIDIKTVQEPNPEAVKAYKPIREYFEDIYQALKPVYKKMAAK